MSALTSAALHLPPGERLKLIEELWNSLTTEAADIPTRSFDLEELQRRRQEYTNNPASLLDWEEVKRQFDKDKQSNAS
jgi:putative addiction module component (TIGR02574 family)